MADQVFAVVLHQDGKPDDTALELLTVAAQVFPGAAPIAILAGVGAPLDTACGAAAAAYSEVWKLGHQSLAHPNAEALRALLVQVLPKGCAVLLPHTTFGMDLGPGLSVKLDLPYLPDVVGIDGVDGTTLTVTRQELSGQVSSHWSVDLSGGAVLTVRPGSFAAGAPAGTPGTVIDKSAEAGEPPTRRRFVELVAAETGDVDIVKEEVLVSVGRGFGDQENLALAEELAQAMGAVVSCSRPVVDAKWLDKSRQVGTSGKTVKPKVYLALGISGAFQHLGGLKGNPFIVAINKNPRAPIFQVATVGVVGDVLELVPALTATIRKGT